MFTFVMRVPVFRILHISGSSDADAVREALTGEPEEEYVVLWVGTLSEGLQRLRAGRFDAIVLTLPDPGRFDTASVAQLVAAAPTAPIIVLGADTQRRA